MLKKLLTLLVSLTLLISLSVPFSADGISAMTALGQYLTDSNAVPGTAFETAVYLKTGVLKDSDSAYIPDPDLSDPVGLAETVLAIVAAGQSPTVYRDKNYCLILAKLQQEDGSFGNDLSATVLSAAALVAAEYEGEDFNETEAADYIMSCKQEDGSFQGQGNPIKETALCVTFLSGCGVQTVVTRNAVSAAADFLRAELTGGELASDPENLCYAILALMDAEGIAETEKNGYPVAALEKYQQEDGSFGSSSLNVLALSAFEADRYGASELKTLMTNGTFDAKLDVEGLLPLLKVFGVIAGLSAIMWVFILLRKKPATGTLEEFKKNAVKDIPVATAEELDISSDGEKEEK